MKFFYFFKFFFFNFYTRFNIINILFWSGTFFESYFNEEINTKSGNYMYMLIHRNNRLFTRLIRREFVSVGKLFTPGTSYIYYFQGFYYLISIFLKGDVEFYKEGEEFQDKNLNYIEFLGQFDLTNKGFLNSKFFV